MSDTTIIREELERRTPPFAGGGDWNDVRRRSGRRGRRVIGAGLVAGLALALLTPAFGLGGLLVDLVAPGRAPLRLPAQADRSRVLVVLEPGTGRVIVRVAPKRRGDGICYVFLVEWSGCASRSRRGSYVDASYPSGYTFDARAAAAEARFASGRVIRLRFRRLPPPVAASFFYARRPARGPAPIVLLLRDRAGTVITRIPLRPPARP